VAIFKLGLLTFVGDSGKSIGRLDFSGIQTHSAGFWFAKFLWREKNIPCEIIQGDNEKN